MHAKTTVARSKSFANDRIWLNGTEENIENPRLANCLKEIRKKAKIDAEEHFHICSENNFPTAAGLASSAAGYACLGKVLSLLEACFDLISGSSLRVIPVHEVNLSWMPRSKCFFCLEFSFE